MGAQTTDENRQFYKIQNELFEKCMHTAKIKEGNFYNKSFICMKLRQFFSKVWHLHFLRALESMNIVKQQLIGLK